MNIACMCGKRKCVIYNHWHTWKTQWRPRVDNFFQISHRSISQTCSVSFVWLASVNLSCVWNCPTINGRKENRTIQREIAQTAKTNIVARSSYNNVTACRNYSKIFERHTNSACHEWIVFLIISHKQTKIFQVHFKRKYCFCWFYFKALFPWRM